MKIHLYVQGCDFGREGYLRLSAEEYEHLRDMCRTHPESVIEINGDYIEEDGQTATVTLIIPIRNIMVICAESERQPRQKWWTQRAYAVD